MDSETFGTPTTVIVKNKKVVETIIGEVNEEDLIKVLKENKVICYISDKYCEFSNILQNAKEHEKTRALFVSIMLYLKLATTSTASTSTVCE